jgi:alpha-tubulin suppressor-like RCC1 family protein
MGLSNVMEIHAHGGTNCVVEGDHSVWCWGYGPDGEIGDGGNTDRTVPTMVPGIAATHVATGLGHICAELTDGSVDCWGQGDAGQQGDGHFNNHSMPTPVPGLSGVTSIAAGGDQACALAASGVSCWGSDVFGQLGDGVVDWLAVRAVDLPCP